MANGGEELSIKGAASGPYIVVAQNFAPGTTAADIESVMLSVGGQMTSCKLAASNPTVIAEMAFVEKSGADKVIDTFNGKKVGRPGASTCAPRANALSRLTDVHYTSTGKMALVHRGLTFQADASQLQLNRRHLHLVQAKLKTWS